VGEVSPERLNVESDIENEASNTRFRFQL
jgi:hypothetical protein